MRRVLHTLRRQERGGALALVAVSITLLMGMAAFGTDLAWFYLNASRIQRAADAASLSGVVYLPTSDVTARSEAAVMATRNGYTTGSGGAVVTAATDEDDGTLSQNQLRVTVSDAVPTFFLKVFGFSTQTITREATAEYIPPLKLGSPENKFGNDPSCYASDPDCAGNFWANIHGTRTDTGMGDAYSSYCELGDGSDDACSQSPQYRDTGYLYGLIPNGNAVTIETLDMAFHYEGAVANGDQHRTGDHNNFCGSFAAPSTCVGQEVTINVYRPDPTPLNILDNTLACSETYSPTAQINPDDDPPFASGTWPWDSVCGGAIDTSSSPDGIWVVQIVANSGGGRTTVLGSGDENHSGLNRYSIRTSTGNIFALGDFSIYNNATGSTTSFYLAEVPDFYAGKTFVIEMYDTGESADTGTLRPLMPAGAGAWAPFDVGTCRIYSRNITSTTWTLQQTINSPSVCGESVTPSEYHGRWLKFELDLPVGYSCGSDCWWRMQYVYPSGVNDTTTWRADLIVYPIHLVP